MSQAVTLATLAAAALELGLCGYYWQGAFAEARPWLPYPLQEQMSARFALDRYIFKPAMPQAARRRYMLSHVFGCIGLVCLTILAYANGPLIGALAFAAVSLAAFGQTFAQWRKYRRLPAQANVSPPVSAP